MADADRSRVARRMAESLPANAIVKFELLADLDDVPNGASVVFDGCQRLGAANLRGTGFASRDSRVHQIRSRVGGVDLRAEVNIAGVAGFLLAKSAAAFERRLPKDWYDIAFVLLHNDLGGPDAAAQAVLDCFADDLRAMRVALDDLKANFAEPAAQGPVAYADQLEIDYPEIAAQTARADAAVAVQAFHDYLFAG